MCWYLAAFVSTGETDIGEWPQQVDRSSHTEHLLVSQLPCRAEAQEPCLYKCYRSCIGQRSKDVLVFPAVGSEASGKTQISGFLSLWPEPIYILNLSYLRYLVLKGLAPFWKSSIYQECFPSVVLTAILPFYSQLSVLNILYLLAPVLAAILKFSCSTSSVNHPPTVPLWQLNLLTAQLSLISSLSLHCLCRIFELAAAHLTLLQQARKDHHIKDFIIVKIIIVTIVILV